MRSRNYSIDIIRGIAVFGMILAHAIDFYHDGTSATLRYLVIFINTISFSTFLFLSGATSYIAYIQKHDSPKTLFDHIKKRLGILLVAYYCIAFISYLDKIIYGGIENQFLYIIKILTFRLVPSYGEFFIPFFVFSLIIIPFHRQLYSWSKKPFTMMATALLIYCVGAAIYQVKMPDFLSPWTAILFGYEKLYRFAVFQYAPVFMAGLLWGKYLLENPESKPRQLSSKLIALYLSCTLLVICIPYLTFKMPISSLFDRWPPTIPFLLAGLLWTFILFYILFSNKELKKHAFTHDLFLLLGQNALALFWTHIVLLKLFKLSGGANISSVFLVVVLFVVLLITSLALSTFVPFNFSFHLTFIRENSGRPFKWFEHNGLPAIYGLSDDVSHKTKFHFRLGYAVLAIIIFIFSTSLYPAAKEKIFAKKNITKTTASWWNDDYSYKRSISITNTQSFTTLKTGSVINVKLDHKQLVNEGKSQSSGNDVQIIYFNGKNSATINREAIDKWSSDQTTLAFELQDNILPKDVSNRYFLYYGNPTVEAVEMKTILADPSTISAILSDEQKHPNYISINRHWFLKPDAVTKNENLIITLADEKNNINNARFEIASTSLSGELEKSLNDWNFYEGSVDVSSLSPGNYKIKVVFDSAGGKKVTSQNIGFTVSYPLYVTWSWDWEGYDVNESYLSKMAELSKKHDVKLTHYFNPRIYTTSSISQERKDHLTSWVKNRRDALGEEVGFHLHMFPDFVSSCGVAAKDSPRWGNYYDGYDILTTAYNYDEMLTLVKCGIQLLYDNGFEMPISYRAGGWYANLDTLRAIQDAGIKVDSSGRTKYNFGTKQAAGFWDLSPTVKPYYPSSNDQNSANPSPRLSILEIPNNGADSYMYTSIKMIERFNINYNKQFLDQPQQITYLSHPHWFGTSEQEEVDKLFNYVDQYKYQNDGGPVKYVLTKDVYEVFK